jgi:hypothetical protein
MNFSEHRLNLKVTVFLTLSVLTILYPIVLEPIMAFCKVLPFIKKYHKKTTTDNKEELV